MEHRKEQQILQTQLEIQEQTFKNISQEIHDNIGQVLSLVKLNINTMDSNQPAPLQEKIDNSRTLISKAIQDLRDLSKSLNTDYVVEQGLMRSIEYELEMIRKTGSYEIEFDTNGKAYRLERQQELIIFRIVQEILHNIIKHAKATKINVAASFEPEIFTLAIADNGQGFDASKIESENYERFGLGIRNMHNRAKMINADFKFTSTLQEGTTVTLTLPITLNL
jgi:signal transduction histidine kinase